MASTAAERTVRVPKENRVVYVAFGGNGTNSDRTVLIPEENRTVIIVERRTTSAERTVYATED